MEQVIRSALGRFAKPAAPSKSALVIVDMNNDRKGILPNRGCLETGIHRVVEVISAARRMCIPVLLVTLPEYPYIMQELLEAAGPSPRTMVKIYRSCFLDPEFAEIINQFAIGTLILGGTKRNKCVLATAEHALQCGFKIMTSDEILFHGLEDDSHTIAHDEQGFYQKRTEFYETSRELISAMGRL